MQGEGAVCPSEVDAIVRVSSIRLNFYDSEVEAGHRATGLAQKGSAGEEPLNDT